MPFSILPELSRYPSQFSACVARRAATSFLMKAWKILSMCALIAARSAARSSWATETVAAATAKAMQTMSEKHLRVGRVLVFPPEILVNSNTKRQAKGFRCEDAGSESNWREPWLCHSDARQVFDLPKCLLKTWRSMTARLGQRPGKEEEFVP